MTPRIEDYLPTRINQGPWLTAYSRDELLNRLDSMRVVLPVCRLGTPWDEIAACGDLVLPPLYEEALSGPLRGEIYRRIHECFPFLDGTRARAAWTGTFEIVELDATPSSCQHDIDVLAFSVDTAVEEHGPHLPLSTDTIQSYGVLCKLAEERPGLHCGPPIDYGQLTWGLPFGVSIDLTAELLARYVSQFVDAALQYFRPRALYVVDVHGSLVHRTAIQRGLTQSGAARWRFRWLHEPLTEFAGQRGDQHAGGVETALVERLNPSLVDPKWWPDRIDELAEHQMKMDTAVELSADLARFVEQAEQHGWNGIVGDIRNYHDLNADDLMARMLEVAEADLQVLGYSSRA